jgi:hypothetical protein
VSGRGMTDPFAAHPRNWPCVDKLVRYIAQMNYDALTALGRVLHLCIAQLWPRLRAEAGIPRQIPLTAMVYARMSRGLSRLPLLLARIDRLALRWRQGTLPKPRARTPRIAPPPAPAAYPAPAPHPTPAPPPTRARDPSRHGWLAHAYPAAWSTGSQIEHLLATDPDLRALAAATPQAGRLLRPLCRMLGATIPDWLRLPPRPRRPRPRPIRARPPLLTDPALGLQPYVIAAARADRRKFG